MKRKSGSRPKVASLFLGRKRAGTIFLLSFLVVIFFLMVLKGIPFAFDNLALIFLVFAFLLGRGRSYIFDWIPFILLLVSYDFLRGFADDVTNRVNVTAMIGAERFLFGEVPTLVWQDRFYHGVGLVEILLTFVYFTHFFVPVFFAFGLWLTSSKKYWDYVWSLLLLSFSAFITFLVYPAGPPWFAAFTGHLPPVNKIILEALAEFPHSGVRLPTLYQHVNPNPVAAVPSLHAGYPALIFLHLLELRSSIAWWFLAYFLVVCSMLIYFGEHYVVDILVGVLYAFFAFRLTLYIRNKKI